MKHSQIDSLQNDFEFDNLQARLNALSESSENSFSQNKWRIKTADSSEFSINFGAFSEICDKYPDWVKEREVDLICITKKLWLSLAEATTKNSYTPRLVGLGKLWIAMASNKAAKITSSNVTQILIFLLTHHWRRGRTIQIKGILSYSGFSTFFPLKQLKIALADAGLDWIASDITEALINKQLKLLIPKLTDEELTYRDWVEGGNLNLLTLDYGRFYIEHCLNFFEKNISLAIALAKTYRAIPEIANSLNYDTKTVSQLVPRILQGYSADMLHSQFKNWSLTTIENVKSVVVKNFEEFYRIAKFDTQLLQDSTLGDLAKSCGLPNLPENIDRMRIVAWHHNQTNHKPETNGLLYECHPSAEPQQFEEQMNRLKNASYNETIAVPSVYDYQSMGLLEAKSIWSSARCYPRQLIRLVEKAGLACIVALTGWRKSEFGFPFSAIKISRNNDKLDEYAFPFRYKVDWYVYKTHDKVRQLREITFNTYIIADRLRQLTGSQDEAPCLYSTTPEKINIFDSGTKVDTAVIDLWENHVSNYPSFKLLDDLQSWNKLNEVMHSGCSLTSIQQDERRRLLKVRSPDQWKSLNVDGNLKEAWLRSRTEWKRLDFFLSNRSNEKINWLNKYRNGSLRSDWMALLDENLSQTTKDWIMSLRDEDCQSNTISRTITNELMADALYPSPHAFRHMWAEAIYRRFDGDAGWMIRSQFKHVTRTMWLAYIRDKDNRRGHQRVKTQVISSLVHNYLRHKGEGYAGQLHIWLRRILQRTILLSPEEQADYANLIATTEIEDIKANPWGYCLLKRRTRHKAKCAEMGEPMRHNASPDLCLNCIHNLMQTSNAEWTLFHISPHVDALKNPIVPFIFKKSSYGLVKNAARHIRTIDPDHEALPELQAVLMEFKKQEKY